MDKNITPLILAYNEAPNIERTLRQLVWAKRIVVIDSFSTDGTVEILNSFPQVEVFQRKFDTAANQDNYGLQQVTTEWVLSLDADYVLTDELVEEIKNLTAQDSINAYWVKFKYCVFGKPLRKTLYPPRRVLYRREKAHYEDDGHTQRVKVEGESAWLSSYILHDDRKSLSRWLSSQDRYMIQEVEKFHRTPAELLGFSDRIRRNKVFAPFIVLFYCLIWQKVILDGWRGWYYALQRVLAEIILAIRLIEKEKLNSHLDPPVLNQIPAENLQEPPSQMFKDLN
ncbi:MAG: glycosyltransferase family 2 protein [Blastocatellia bacterium]